MNLSALKQLLEQIRSGETSVDDALVRLKSLPFEDIDFAKVDHHRQLRCGFPEVIYCEGKTPEQVEAIFSRHANQQLPILATRANVELFERLQKTYPALKYHELARCITLRTAKPKYSASRIAIVAAGTSDLPVAEEARVTAEMMDQKVEAIYDVGVAGVHRLLAHAAQIQQASVVVAVAGMEGALASVVGGLVSAPVIAVPTSVGYGASFHGLAPLLTMLNSCASNVAVVNIDNGFGAGYLAAIINRLAQRGACDESAT